MLGFGSMVLSASRCRVESLELRVEGSGLREYSIRVEVLGFGLGSISSAGGS